MVEQDNSKINQTSDDAALEKPLVVHLDLPKRVTLPVLMFWKAMDGLMASMRVKVAKEKEINDAIVAAAKSNETVAPSPTETSQPIAADTATRSLAIIGGGLAGLMSAFHAKAEKPDAHVMVYEKGSETTYTAGGDDSGRASLSGSPARTMRLTPATPGISQWRTQETLNVIRTLEADMAAHPQDYPEHLRARPLLRPQVSIITAPPTGDGSKDPEHVKRIVNFEKMGVAFKEATGAELKAQFPGFFTSLPDNAMATIEAAAGASAHNVAGTMDVEAIMGALTAYLKKQGVTFHYNAQVANIDDTAQGAHISFADGTSASADHAIVAPGQWIEQIKNSKGESLSQAKGIKPRFDSAMVVRIDLKALGIDTPAGIPFSKGFSAKGGEGTYYSHQPDGTEGIVKFIPAATIQSFGSIEALRAPMSEEASKARQEAALDSAAIRFSLDKETLRPHTQFSTCIYTSPEKGEKLLVTPLSEHVTLIGLDSSGMARTSGGYGHIAANMALGKDEPYEGAYKATGLAAHYEQVGAPAIVAAKDCTVEPCNVQELAQAQQRGVA